METNDDDRSLRRIVLRLLNVDEDLAREELDKIIQAIEEYIGHQSTIHAWSMPVMVIFPFVFLLASLAALFMSKSMASILSGLAALACLVPLFMTWRWHRFQYGTGRLRKPRDAIYVDASDETRAALEKLFAYLRRESAPRAYYRNRQGEKCYLERRYSFGALRVLLLSDFAAVRELCLTPAGGRISEVIKIDADPEEVIKALNIKPKRAGGPGRDPKHRYYDAIISLIGDVRLTALDLTDQVAAIAAIKRRLSDWCEEHADASGDVPRGDQLAPYARKIYDHLKTQMSSGRR